MRLLRCAASGPTSYGFGVHSEILDALLDKYRRMRAMREAHARGGDDAAPTEMRALATEFPGALREIDRLPMRVIEERIGALEAAREGGPVPDWAPPLAAFHGWMRAMLRLKRAMRRSRDLDAARRWLRDHHAGTGFEPSLAQLEAALPALLAPHDGRMARAVLAHLTGDDARALERRLFDG